MTRVCIVVASSTLGFATGQLAIHGADGLVTVAWCFIVAGFALASGLVLEMLR